MNTHKITYCIIQLLSLQQLYCILGVFIHCVHIPIHAHI